MKRKVNVNGFREVTKRIFIIESVHETSNTEGSNEECSDYYRLTDGKGNTIWESLGLYALGKKMIAADSFDQIIYDQLKDKLNLP